MASAAKTTAANTAGVNGTTTASGPGGGVTLVRRLFVAAWLLLIGSLFWDPFSTWLTSGATGLSPWQPPVAPVLWQGQPVAYAAYPLATQILWGVLVPLLPLGMMVFGARRWGQICPLSSLMQLPAKLGLQRRQAAPALIDIRLSPKVSPTVAKVPVLARASWLARNHWYVQFGLLFLFLNGRLLFINSDRISLALFFVGLIAAAITVGYRYGGKTWCNHLCPMAPVQKIFSQPGALLDGPPQSVAGSCPTVTGANGTEAVDCVGCTDNCPDTDPNRHYWADLDNPGRRFTYFGYFGLILGFYSYYFLYAGNWDYYLSGAWTHVSSQTAELFGPGFYIAGQAIAIPKLLAVPLTLGFAVITANLLLNALRRGYLAYRHRRGRFDDRLASHRFLSVLVFATFNGYYLFSGKPTLQSLPGLVEPIISLILLTLSVWWLWRMLRLDDPAVERRVSA